MPLEDYRSLIERCVRCSHCKHVPYVALARVDRRFRPVCPSNEKYHFHSWSAGGRTITSYSLMIGELKYSPKVIDVVYQCLMCGACDVSCKIQMDLEPYEVMLELRVKCVEDGQIPVEFIPVIEGLRKDDNMLQKPKSERGKWAEGLNVKKLPEEKAEVVFHAGCRFSFDEGLWSTARKALTIIKEAGVDVGIFGVDEACCGGRAYEMGYQGELVKYMDHNVESWRNAGVKTVVTPCSDCYATFKAWYSRFGRRVQVMHIVEYLERLVREGTIKLTREVPMKVTWHDPCHLGRRSEPYLYSAPGKPYITPEKKIMGIVAYDPPKPWRRGAKGIYDPPRNVLSSIPGLKLVEMHRIREYAWCCGAGGGVTYAYPEFSAWTAKERIKEARAVGAKAIVTACGWCERNFRDAVKDLVDGFEVYDIVDLVWEAMGR
ncbi:MAG: (Fe-S)-binding protein [Candidatus Nezhaarchaeota archaeon]|nr:(Fe-S)-binding protein [Candidatus Nezhaarchaeota archaeon]